MSSEPVPSDKEALLPNWCVTAIRAFLVLLAVFGVGRGIVGAVHPLNPRYWDGSNDFQWSPSRVLLEGTDPYALYAELGRANNAPLGSPFILSQWADYPPSSLMILWPLAALPWPVAKWIWLAINLVSIGAIIWVLSRLFRLRCEENRWTSKFVWFVLLFLACPSVSSTLKSGQHGLFSIATFLLAVWLCQERKPPGGTWLAGFVLALSWLKYSMTVPLSLFFVTRKRWPTLGIAAGLHLLATLFAGLWSGTSPVTLLKGNLEVAAGNLGLVAFDLSQTVSRVGLPGYVMIVALFAGAMLLAITRACDRDDGEILSMLSFFSFVLLPHLRYDLFMLVIPLAFAMSQTGRLRTLILVSIVQLWFLREIVETLIGQRPKESMLATISLLVVGFSVLLLYLPIAASWIRLVRPDKTNTAT